MANFTRGEEEEEKEEEDRAVKEYMRRHEMAPINLQSHSQRFTN